MDVNKDESMSREEIRNRRKAKNKAKKEELKRVKEDEKRRELSQPKDQRVRVVPFREAEFYQSSLRSSDCLSHPAPSLSKEFPSLGAEKPRSKPDRKTSKLGNCQQQEQSGPSQCKEQWKEAENVDNQVHPSQMTPTLEMSKNSVQLSIPSTKMQCVKPKRSAPIHVDLLTVIQRTKSLNTTEKRTVPPAPAKKRTTIILSGNQLDSSNPERKKGKKREIIKPPKPTRLKSVILQDRCTRERGANDDDTGGLESNLEGNPTAPDVGTPLPRSADDTDLRLQGSLVSEVEVAPRTPERNEEATLRTLEERLRECVETSQPSSPTTTHENGTPSDEKVDRVKLDCRSNKSDVNESLHSKKFREYCDHMPSPALDDAIRALIQDVVKFQDRLYFNDPIKAHIKRRFVLGFRETKKYLQLKKIKLIIVAPDLEEAKSEGGIDDTVSDLKTGCEALGVPCVFALGRKHLRSLTNKSFRIKGISCVGVISYEGSQDNFRTIQEILPELRTQYQQLAGLQPPPSPAALEVDLVEDPEPPDINQQVVTSFLEKLTQELGKA